MLFYKTMIVYSDKVDTLFRFQARKIDF